MNCPICSSPLSFANNCGKDQNLLIYNCPTPDCVGHLAYEQDTLQSRSYWINYKDYSIIGNLRSGYISHIGTNITSNLNKLNILLDFINLPHNESEIKITIIDLLSKIKLLDFYN